MEFPSDSAAVSSSLFDANLVTANMVLPRQVETKNSTKDYGRFVIGPLESGYGLTLGNSLRRVLLSSLPGAAVTSIRINDVPHDFSEIPFVREDTTQLILQVKQLRLLLHGVDSARMTLHHRGAEGTVTAADILAPPEVQIENPSLYLFTVDDSNIDIEMEFEVSSGRGYSPAEDRERLPAGELPIDATFSPIKRVNFEVDSARVGQRTNYDNLVLELWTNGTISPELALAQSAQILMHFFKPVAGVDVEQINAIDTLQHYDDQQKIAPFYEKPIEELDLSVRVFNSLKRHSITSVGDVLETMKKGNDAMLAIRNFGEKSLDELEEKLQAKGYWPSPEDEKAE